MYSGVHLMEAGMEQTIHPLALKKLREKRGWSQKQLADKCKFRPETVSRWERGKIGRIRSLSRERLIKVFNVSWEELTRAPDDKETKLFPTVQLNYGVRPEVRTALWLVCLRYGLRPADVIELAPLLFLITAEKSLAQRQENLDAIEERVERAMQESRDAAPHLAPAFYQRMETDDAINDEQESINRRDVFCHGVAEPYDVEDHDPYTTYLKTLAADLPSGLVEEIVPSYPSGPRYAIAQDTLREVIGISGDNEDEQELLRLIWDGNLKLSEIVSKKENLSREEYLHWLSDQREATKAEKKAAQKLELEKFMAKLGIDAADGGTE